MSTPSSAPAADSAGNSPRAELKAFAGLPQALARLILRDGRSRKEVAQAAELNASMLSGYCSGRRIPSLEHLDRLLTTLGVGIEELTYELRALDYRAPSNAPLVVWPKSLETKEGAAAGALLTVLLEDLRELLAAQARAAGNSPGPEPGPAKAPRRRRT
ncbi:MAG TPA: helix-turn-helix transcriptional regulator [Thermoanaerobaculia bacterium]|jgi:transcriptional regulator with XRE-family HTH domain|nr:helix-turn-helix transcriptional regulator [Thermoanaerobaculia bacterium]